MFWEICWKLTKYWKISLSCLSKMPAIFCRKLIKIIWDHQDVSSRCVHLTMVLFLLKGAWRQSYRSTKTRLHVVLHQFTKRNVSIMKRCIGENVFMKGRNDSKKLWKKYLNKSLKWKKDVSVIQINATTREEWDQWSEE